MSSVAIILARGGSKRIPNKNIKDFCGQPLLNYSIQTAISSKCFDEVMVSTDSEEIADIAKKVGAQIPFLRSKAASDDFATTMDALKDVLKSYSIIGREFDSFCCIYPASVMISPADIVTSSKIFHDGEVDFLTTILPFSYPIQRALKIKDNKMVKFIEESSKNKRSQDLEVFYHDAGQFYWGNCKAVDSHDSFWDGKVISYQLDEMQAQDIDNIPDWKIAEFKYNYFLEK